MDEPDFESLLSEFDLRDMAGFTRKFVEDLRSSLTTGLDLEEDTDWSGVLCLGMGGSGAGGLFLKALSDDLGGLPFVVWTDYGVPSWWGPEWLVIATSYSGNTEETIDGIREVISSGGTVIGICSGGEMENVILTPHTGGETRLYEDNVLDVLVENIKRLENGDETLMNQIV